MASCTAGCQYIPSIEYFAHWIHHGTICIEAHEHFQKRAWRNKTAILGPGQALLLSVPLKKGKHQQMPIMEVEISYEEPWNRIHFNSMETAYGKTAYYNEIESDLKNIYFSGQMKLWDLNIAFLRLICSLIPGKSDFDLTLTYEKHLPANNMDLRHGIPAGVSSVPIEKLPRYDQVQRLHKSHFPNLSILDLLCHLGPESGDYLVRYANQLYPSSC